MESTLDLWADDMEPVAQFRGYTYVLRPRPNHQSEYKTGSIPVIYVEVDQGDGLLECTEYTWFNGKKFRDMTWEEKREVYDYLIEWEFAEWRRIGPEDSELFATEKLHSESV